MTLPNTPQHKQGSSAMYSIAFVLLSLATMSHAFVESPMGRISSPLSSTVSQRFSQVPVAPLMAVPAKKSAISTTTASSSSSQRKQGSSSTALKALTFWKTDPKGFAVDYPDTRARFLAGILATIFTWHGINVNGMNPVMASSATTLAISLWSPGLGQAAFCGSFAGMNANGNWPMILTCASLTATSFEMLIHRGNKFYGLGGKLSFQAFMASNIVALLFGKATWGWMSRIPTSLAAWGQVIQASPIGYGMLCGALGAVLTIFLREVAEYDHDADNDLQDPVRSSAVIGILAAMAVGLGGYLDDYGAMIMFGGAFTGMSYPSRLLKGKGGWSKVKRADPTPLQTLFWFAVAGAFGGFIHAVTLTLKLWTGGWGGKAGTCAFTGALVFRLCERIHYKVRQRFGWVQTPVNCEAVDTKAKAEKNTTSVNDFPEPSPVH